MQRGLFRALVVLLVLAAFVCAGCGRSAQNANPDGTTRSLVQISSPSGSMDVMGGEYRVYNNVWGASTPQTIEVETTNTYWKVLSTGHNQSGGPPAAYPFILKGSHFGQPGTTKNNPLPVAVPNVVSAPTSYSIGGTGAAGIWNAAYDVWFVQGGTNKLEMMIWINYKGGCQPAGSKVATVSLAGYTWEVWKSGAGAGGVLSYRITTLINSISFDVKTFMNDAVSRGYLSTAWSLGAFEAGFEIWTNGTGLTVNSFSADCNPTGGTNPPGSFSLTSPANGATGVATNPTLSWGSSSGATSYTLVVDDNSNYSSPIFNQNVGNVTSKQVTGLANSTTYYWKVTATNSYGSTPASNNSFSFTTGAAPPPSDNLALNRPATASSVEKAGCEAGKAVDGSTTTRWSSLFSDPQWIYVDLGAAYDVSRVVLRWESAYGKSFKIQVSNNASTWTDAYSTTTGTGGVQDISFAAKNGRYVRMYGTARGTSYGYSLWEFEVYGSGGSGSPPGSFSLSSPPNGATGQSTSPTLNWGASSGATSYTLVVDNNSDYSSPVFNQDVGNVTAKQVTGLANSTTYYWKVTAHNSYGDTAASNNSFHFTTQAGGGTTTRYEGENSTGKNEVKTWPSGYSGTGIGVRWSNGAMTWSVNFSTAGTYSFTVRCNDYSGTQNFTVQIDGVNKGSYSMTAGDKSWKTFTGSFGSVTAGTHTVGVNFTSDSANSDLYCDYIDITGP